MNQPGITEFVCVRFARGEWLAVRDDGRIIGRGKNAKEASAAALNFMGTTADDFAIDYSAAGFIRYALPRAPGG
jgi:hypothetical protein